MRKAAVYPAGDGADGDRTGAARTKAVQQGQEVAARETVIAAWGPRSEVDCAGAVDHGHARQRPRVGSGKSEHRVEPFPRHCHDHGIACPGHLRGTHSLDRLAESLGDRPGLVR